MFHINVILNLPNLILNLKLINSYSVSRPSPLVLPERTHSTPSLVLSRAWRTEESQSMEGTFHSAWSMVSLAWTSVTGQDSDDDDDNHDDNDYDNDYCQVS